MHTAQVHRAFEMSEFLARVTSAECLVATTLRYLTNV